MKTISREELRRELDGATPPAIVEVLAPQEFRTGHLPSAINVPFDAEFDTHIRGAVPDLNAWVVVYCASTTCTASGDAARKMEALGYTNVMRYEGGKADWREGKLPMEPTAAPARAAR